MPTLLDQLQVAEREAAIDAVQSRLIVAAVSLHAFASGIEAISTPDLKHLALELRAIALGLDALRSDSITDDLAETKMPYAENRL